MMTRKLPARKPAAEAAKRPRVRELPADLADDLAGFKVTPLRFLMGVINDEKATRAERIRCACAAAQYLHTRTRDGGKGEQREAKAKAAAKRGRFKPMREPRGRDDD
jgi:hypothetical protein